MGKNYAESSLKHYLKQKVRITLGLVVTFLITGVCAFGGSIDLSNEDYQKAENSLNELGQHDLAIGNGEIGIDKNDTSKKIKITEKEGVYTITYTGINAYPSDSVKKVEISKKYLSGNTVNNINKFLNSQDKEYKLITEALTEDIAENQFVQNNTSEKFVQQATGTKNITNNGYILGYYGQKVENGEAVNNGTIMSDSFGQSSSKGNGNLINNGLIVLAKDVSYGQYVNKGKAYNYGTIIGKQYLQATTKLDAGTINTIELYNYGVLKSIDESSGDTRYQGQVIDAQGAKAYNYGLIDGKNNLQFSVNGRWSTLLSNYGTLNISSQNGVAQTHHQGSSENYGLIKIINGAAVLGDKDSIIGKAVNRGVIHSSGNSEIYKNVKTIDNTGIIITNADLSNKEWSKTGVTLNTNYELQNTDTAVTVTGDTFDNSSFGDKNIGYINATDRTSSIKISDIRAEKDKNGNTIKKVIGIVADDKNTQDDKKPVVFETDKNLLLEELDMTGYLVNGGTLIDMNGNDLILSNANITVTEDLTKTNGEKAVAVDLGTGKLSLMGDSEINGIIKGEAGSVVESVAQKDDNFRTEGETVLEFKNADADIADINYTDIKLTGTDAGKIVTEFNKTSEGKENTIEIGRNFVLGTADDYKTETVIQETSKEGNKSNYIIDNLDNIHGNISLGAGENTVTVNSRFEKYDGKIDLGAGEDKFIVTENVGYNVINTFNHVVYNAETVELKGGVWGNWNEAHGSIRFDESTKDVKTPNLTLGDKTVMRITLNTENEGSDFANFISDDLHMKHAVITGTGNGSAVKYWIGYDGLDSTKLSSDKYSFGEGINTDVSAIFKVDRVEGKETTVTVKTAEDMGLSGQDRIIYNAYLNEIKADGNVNTDVVDQINGYNSSEAFVKHIKDIPVTGEAYYTAGSVVTMDIADTYMSAVEDFTKRAGKGEWLAQGKYLNSDTEFDGGSKVKGYDGDVTGTVGMIEYGLTENTSYGAVFGMGDSEMDIDGGGKLDGDNTYAGLYMKHRTSNGIELVANIGYVENDMDSVLRNDFEFGNNTASGNGKTFEKGTADSSAVVIGVKGRKDYRISDTVKLQPVLGARATLINQDEAENPEMHFTIKEQDIIVLEGTAGMGIAKEIALSEGKLELNAGAEYTFAASSSTNDAEYTLFDTTEVKLEDTDAAENTGTIYIGADYEHESGIGFNGKYEMLWSDKGDDSRITAGVSYRF